MEVTVNMSVEELQEFVAWKEDREKYTKGVERLRRDMGTRMEVLASAACKAVKPKDNTFEAFEITEQGYMADA